MRIVLRACSYAIVATLFVFSSAVFAQDEGTNEEVETPAPEAQVQSIAPPVEPVTPGAVPPPPAEPPPPPYIGGPVQGFKIQQTATNTYTVTQELRGLQCVKGVGSEASCAITHRSDGGEGYPWTLLKCKAGDASIRTFARSLDNRREINIFDAPPSLVSSVETYGIDVRLSRVCKRPGQAGGVKK